MPIKYNDGTKLWTPKYALYNGTTINKIYYGSTKVFEQAGWTYSNTTPGQQTIHIPVSGVYDIHIVGAGGGATHRLVYVNTNYYWYTAASGGSGGHVWWWQYLEAGDYTITIGEGGKGQNNSDRNGGSTVFLGQTAGGGTGGDASSNSWDSAIAGGAGTNSTSYNNQTGNPGNRSPNDIGNTLSGGESVYAGFGEGGSRNGNGGNGGVMITFKSLGYPVIFESATAGNYTINITNAGNYHIDMVGGGGYQVDNYWWHASGGSGAYITGNIYLDAGSYPVTVAVAGSSYAASTAFGQTAGGGERGYANLDGTRGGAGGTATVTVSTLTGLPGNPGEFQNGYNAHGGASLYKGYGRGGGNATGSATGGYLLVYQISGK